MKQVYGVNGSNMSRLILSGFPLVFLMAVASRAEAQCVSDAECRGERVCIDGGCRSPGDYGVVSPTSDEDGSAVSTADPGQASLPATPGYVAHVIVPADTATTPAHDADRFVGYIEWASVRVGMGNYGGHGGVSLFTLRWRWFYWTILNISGGGGLPGGNDEFDHGYYGTAGTRVGVPLHLGEGGRHDIRLGAGIAGGIVQMEVFRRWWQRLQNWYCTSYGPFLQIEALYQFHILRRVAILAGYEGTFVFNEANDNGYPEDNWQPADVHAGFLGLAF